MKIRSSIVTMILMGLMAGTGIAQEGEPGPGDTGMPRPREAFRRRVDRDESQGLQGRGPERFSEDMLLGKLLADSRFAEQLGITAEQKEKLRTQAEDLRSRQEALKTELEAAAVEQAKLIMADDMDEAALMAAVEKTGAIRTEMAKLRMKHLLLVKTTLTPEQLQSAKDMIKARARRARMQGQGRPHGERPEDGGTDGPAGNGKGRRMHEPEAMDPPPPPPDFL